MLNRRVLILCAGRVAVSLPAVLAEANVTGQHKGIPDTDASQNVKSNALWLCVGRAALASKSKGLVDGAI